MYFYYTIDLPIHCTMYILGIFKKKNYLDLLLSKYYNFVKRKQYNIFLQDIYLCFKCQNRNDKLIIYWATFYFSWK